MRNLLIAFIFIFSAQGAFAATVSVSSVAALQTAINSASSGDTIVLANGTYLNNTLTIATDNITVRAATPGGVYLNGTNAISITGNSVLFRGFQFTSGSIAGIVVTVEGNYVTLSELNFKGYSAQKYINLKGQYDVVSRCNFENKPASAPKGNLIHIYTRDDAAPNYATVRYCSFQNMPGAGGDNGNECIRITNAAPSTYKSRTIVEYCFFSNTGAGDSEVISVKSEENILRYNTMTNNNGGNFCFRYGDNNVAYGNFFINSGGIRLKQANNIYCYNNYFENCGDGSITAPVKYVYVAGALSNLNFIHNTFVGGSPIEFGSGAASNTWANNIFKNTTGNIFSGSVEGITFAGNIYSDTPGVTIASGITPLDPQLVLNSNGYYGLTASSPAIDNASSAYPALPDIPMLDDDPNIQYDITGRNRPSTPTLKDVGCEEFSANGNVLNKPLTLTDVGPAYLCSGSSAVKPLKKDGNNCTVYPNPNKGIFHVNSDKLITEITVFSMTGEKLSGYSDIYQKSVTIRLPETTKSVYYIQLTNEDKAVLIKKVIVE